MAAPQLMRKLRDGNEDGNDVAPNIILCLRRNLWMLLFGFVCLSLVVCYVYRFARNTGGHDNYKKYAARLMRN